MEDPNFLPIVRQVVVSGNLQTVLSICTTSFDDVLINHYALKFNCRLTYIMIVSWSPQLDPIQSLA